MTIRVFVAEVRQGFGPDLLDLAAETPHRADFRALTKVAGTILTSLRLPAGIKAAG